MSIAPIADDPARKEQPGSEEILEHVFLPFGAAIVPQTEYARFQVDSVACRGDHLLPTFE